MAKEMETPKDEGLQGNETIEEAILGLQKEPTPELLAHVLTVIRRRMKEGGQAILSVEPPSGDDQIRIGTYECFLKSMSLCFGYDFCDCSCTVIRCLVEHNSVCHDT